MKIGMFDSGIGGLTVLQKAIEMMPGEEYHYYADVDHVPYGSKTVEEIQMYSGAATNFLIEKGCDVVVIACNTATSAACRMLRGMVDTPLVGIEPAVKPAVEREEERKVLVIATPVTVREPKLHDLVLRVDTRHQVELKALPGLVDFAEHGVFEGDEVDAYLKEELASFSWDEYGVLVFGCTHFNHFAKSLRKVTGPGVKMIDGSAGTVRRAGDLTRPCPSEGLATPVIHYYQSGREVTDQKTLTFYSNVLIHLKQMQEYM